MRVERVELGTLDAVVQRAVAESHLSCAAESDDAYGLVDVGPLCGECLRGGSVAGELSFGSIDGALFGGEGVGGDGQQSAAAPADSGVLECLDVVEIDDGVALGGGDDEAVLEGGVVGLEASVHSEGVLVEVIDTADRRRGIGASAAYVVPADEVARIVCAEGADNLVAVGRRVGEIACVALQACAPREGDEAVGRRGAHDVLATENICVLLARREVVPRRGLEVGRRGCEVHEVSHHDAVAFDAHAPRPYVAVEEPRSVLRRLLACLDVFVGHILEQQGVGIAEEAGGSGVTGDLVEEEEAPVVAVGHGQFAVGQGQALEHLVEDLLLVVHQGVGLPLLFAALEEEQGQVCLAQFLHDDVLVGGVEEVVVLQRVVVVEVLSAVVVGHGLLVVGGVDEGLVGGIVNLRVAVDGKGTQAVEPSLCQRVVGIEAEGAGQHVGLPAVLFGLGVAGIACGDRASELVVALRLYHIIYICALRVGELVVEEVCGEAEAHGPQRALPGVVAGRCAAPVGVVRRHLQAVGFMRGVAEDEASHGHILDFVPRDVVGECDLALGVFDEEG